MGEFYLQKQKEMDEKFKNVIIMMEIGKFYEVYTFETSDGELGMAKEMSRICNIILTRKNKNLPPSLSNPFMCGFPSHSLTRYVQHLVSHSYTVAVYSQQNNDQNKLERVLQGVYSPSVMIGEMEDENMEDMDRCIMSLSVDRVCFLDRKRPDMFSVSYVCVSTTHGDISCEETVFSQEQEAVSFVMKINDIYRPQEILLRSCIDLEMTAITHELPAWKNEHNKYAEMGFQEIVLEKVYTDREHAAISVVEEIGLERNPELVSVLVYTICFLEQHHPLAIYRLRKPSFLQHTKSMYYNTQSLYDLDLFSSQQKGKSLLEILDNTCTPAGKRLLRKTMFAPHYDTEKLLRSYDEISALIPILPDMQLRKKVAFYNTDTEHVLRKIQTGNAGVSTVFRFIKMLFDFIPIMSQLPAHLEISRQWQHNELEIEKVQEYVLEKWEMTMMQSWRSWETDMVWRVTPDALVEKQKELDKNEIAFKNWVHKEIGQDMFQRVVYTEEEAYVSITKKMYQEMNRKDLRIRLMSNSYRVQHSNMDRYFQERKRIMGLLVRLRRQIFQEQVRELVDDHEKILAYMVNTTAYVDMIISHTTNAVRFRLERPEPTKDKGVMSCRQLRHLVVESSHPNSNYIANDVELSDQHGILLFGQNSAGKCFKRDTPIVLWDGTIKPIQELTTDDVLIGDDGTPRHIIMLTEGEGTLYDIIRCDTSEILMTVNAEHIMCLTDGSKYWEEPLRNLLCGHGYAGMFQHTRCVSYHHNQTDGGLLVARENGMDDYAWHQIYIKLLHSGRRISYADNYIKIEPVKNNRLAFWVRERTRRGKYYGFGLDGNQRFLMPDGNVCHNSTLMKSVGVSVMMAQCGMFVPCSSMRWTPMTSLFTKIGSRDDIWKGKSTFITEMNELKHILDRANERSLILCDELTSGTETYSATGIVAGTLETFLEKKSKFIMTTHLHTLNQFQALLTHPQLRVMHFSMQYDKENRKLVFDRVLREGSGKSIYGLEIAEYLNFPEKFLKRAFHYRSQLDPKSVSMEPKRRSRYNAKKWVDKCEHCGDKTELHTHHIGQQKDATEDGYIGRYHKNRLSNLKVLCRSCHEKEHS